MIVIDKSIGILEVMGLSIAMFAMDKACKESQIKIESIDCDKPIKGNEALIPLCVQVKFIGDISQVQVALDIARIEAGKSLNDDDIITQCIPINNSELYKLIRKGKVSLKRF